MQARIQNVTPRPNRDPKLEAGFVSLSLLRTPFIRNLSQFIFTPERGGFSKITSSTRDDDVFSEPSDAETYLGLRTSVDRRGSAEVGGGRAKGNEGWMIVWLLGLALVLCNADRVIMSVAIVPMANANQWGTGVAGIVQSSFLWGYLLTPIMGGSLADGFGGKPVLAVGMLLWSSATLLTPWAAQTSLPALLATRVAMGLGEGVALPCMNHLVGRWIGKAERGRAVGICFAGFHLGSMMGLVLSPFLSRLPLGIFTPFFFFGALGLLWTLLWLFLVPTSPPPPSSLHTPASTTPLQGKSQAKEHAVAVPWKLPPFGLLLSRGPTWAIIFANAVNSWGYFILLSWMPLYFSKVLGVGLASAAWFSAAPWVVMAAMGVVAGTASDFLSLSWGLSTTAVRKIMQSVGFLGPACSLMALSFADKPLPAVLLLTVALGFSSFSQAGFLVNYQEIAPNYVGVLHGVSNTAGTAAGIGSTIIAGFMVEKFGSFKLVLWITCFFYFLGAAIWNLLATGERVF